MPFTGQSSSCWRPACPRPQVWGGGASCCWSRTSFGILCVKVRVLTKRMLGCNFRREGLELSGDVRVRVLWLCVGDSCVRVLRDAQTPWRTKPMNLLLKPTNLKESGFERILNPKPQSGQAWCRYSRACGGKPDTHGWRHVLFFVIGFFFSFRAFEVKATGIILFIMSKS